MTQVIIADSSALVSLISQTDDNHPKAQQTLKILQDANTDISAVIIPSDVFSETLNVVGKKAGHAYALRGAKIMLTHPAFTLVASDQKVREQALALFAHQPESVSFTDCMVMAIADRYQSKKIFGFDESFKKSGYLRIGVDETTKAK